MEFEATAFFIHCFACVTFEPWVFTRHISEQPESVTCKRSESGSFLPVNWLNSSHNPNHFLLSFLSGRKGLLSMFPVQFPELQLRSHCFLDVKHSQAPITFQLASAVQELSQVNEWANLLFLRIKSLQLFFLLTGGGRYGDWRGREPCDGKAFFLCIPFCWCKAVGKHVFPTMVRLRQRYL